MQDNLLGRFTESEVEESTVVICGIRVGKINGGNMPAGKPEDPEAPQPRRNQRTRVLNGAASAQG